MHQYQSQSVERAAYSYRYSGSFGFLTLTKWQQVLRQESSQGKHGRISGRISERKVTCAAYYSRSLTTGKILDADAVDVSTD